MNALRLVSDAKLLYDNDRHASSFALTVIASEEVGKLIVNIWTSQRALQFRNGSRITHRRKQAAVGALLLAKQAKEIIDAEITKGTANMRNDQKSIDLLSHKLLQTEAIQFCQQVEMGAIDKTKELALYRDGWLSKINLHADMFDTSTVKPMLEKTLDALETVVNPLCMKAGRAVYELYLEREQYRKTGRAEGSLD